MPHHEQERRNRLARDRHPEEEWAQQVPWERGRGPYRDYGWEEESALPEFRDPSVHVMDYERDRAERWRRQEKRFNRQPKDISGPYAGIGPKGYRRSDERIKEEVCERLTQHGQIDARQIEIDVKDGEVILSGSTHSRHDKRMVEDTISSVHGIRDIHNQLRVDQQSHSSQNRIDRVGKSGVYPASGPLPNRNAETQDMASWGQGERGAAGYNDSGRSEIQNPDPEQNREKK